MDSDLQAERQRLQAEAYPACHIYNMTHDLCTISTMNVVVALLWVGMRWWAGNGRLQWS